jgi:transposase-like protein
METTETEVVTLERGRDAKGRRLYSKERREALMAEYDASGLTQTQFAKKHGIKFMTFVTWLQHRRHGAWPAQMKSRQVKFEEVALPRVMAKPTTTEILVVVTLPEGTRIEGARPGDVAELLRALRG